MGKVNLNLNTKEFEKEITKIKQVLISSINSAVHGIAEESYYKVMELAKQRLPKNLGDKYIQGLNFEQINPTSWVISLETKEANELEDGISGYDLRETLLRSKKLVSEGRNAGKPWVQTSKTGNKFARVPFSPKGIKRPNNVNDLAQVIKSVKGRGVNGAIQNIDQVFMSAATGKPIIGKVATAINAPEANLKGLTKYQKMQGEEVLSFYKVYRTISNAPSKMGGWRIPDKKGIKIFDEIQNYVDKAIEDLINKL